MKGKKKNDCDRCQRQKAIKELLDNPFKYRFVCQDCYDVMSKWFLEQAVRHILGEI